MLAGLTMASAAFPRGILAQTSPVALNGVDFGLVPNQGSNQSEQLRAAIGKAVEAGLPLFLPAGRYLVSGVELPSNISISGIAGATILEASVDGAPVMGAQGQSNVTVEGLSFDGRGLGENRRDALLAFEGCTSLNIRNCSIGNANNNGLSLGACSGRVEGCEISACRQSAIHLQNSAGILLTGNTISSCGNGGIRVWRSESGADGTIVVNNRISDIGSDEGDGQNGNGVNIFRADRVIVSDNVIEDCAFSAVRANATNDTIISGNQCINSSEVAIFSEFAFSGSIISNNIIDGAARGISMTNFNDGGRLAVCSGNIVRNIMAFSPTNPRTRPIGIFAEADAAVSGNVVENVPGIGISAGWGPFLRNVLVSGNVVRKTLVGIGVSVAKGAGPAKISNNLIADAEHAALAGLAWRDIISTDLVADAQRFPHILLSNNSVVQS